MTHTNLSLLSDAELIRHVDNGLDKLTSTDIEVELLERFERHSNTLRELSPVLEFINDHETDASQVAEGAECLAGLMTWEGEQMTLDQVCKEIEFAKEVRNLLQQYGHTTTLDLENSLAAMHDICLAIKNTKFSTATPTT